VEVVPFTSPGADPPGLLLERVLVAELLQDGTDAAMKTFVEKISEVLSSVHRNTSEKVSDRSRETLLQEALEHVIDGTDGRVRLVNGYRKKLLGAIKRSLVYTEQLVNRIPGTIEITRNNFVSNQYVNAFFTNPRELKTTFEQSSELAEFFGNRGDGKHDVGWALLCMQKQEKTVFGVDLQSGEMRREVQQTAVSFFDQHIYSPAPSETELRNELKSCMFEGLITNALGHIVERRTRRGHLETERGILHGRLRHVDEESKPVIRERLDKVGRQLNELGLTTPQACLDEVEKVFSRPENYIRLRNISMKLDKMGIKIEQDSTQPSNELELAEVEIEREKPRVVVLARLQPESFHFRGH
jgi:hypothetical protein